MDDDRKRIMVVDDDPVLIGNFSELLQRSWESTIIKTSQSFATARDDIYINEYDLYIFDIDLADGDGRRLIEDVRKGIGSDAPIVMLSGHDGEFEECRRLGANNCIQKPIEMKYLAPFLKSIFRRNKELDKMSGYEDFISVISQTFQKDNNGVSGGIDFMTLDGHHMKYDVYHLQEHAPNSFTIGIANSVGCSECCLFCDSRNRKFVRGMSTEEIMAQIYHAMNSIIAQEVYLHNGQAEIRINFTCEGDPVVSNLENTVGAIRMIKALLPGVEIIVTTIGSEKFFQRIIDEYLDDFCGIKVYWSANFLNPEIRRLMMPTTRYDDLGRMRELFLKIAQAGVDATLALILTSLMKKEDARMIKAFTAKPYNFPIKIQGLECCDSRSSLYQMVPIDKGTEKFTSSLDQIGVRYRLVKITGYKQHSGCGSTIPVEGRKFC